MGTNSSFVSYYLDQLFAIRLLWFCYCVTSVLETVGNDGKRMGVNSRFVCHFRGIVLRFACDGFATFRKVDYITCIIDITYMMRTMCIVYGI